LNLLKKSLKFLLLFNFRFNLNFIRFSKTVYMVLDQTREVTVGAPQRMRIGATCPISKIERSISRLFRTNREDFLHVTLWCQRLHRGPQTAGICVSRMNGDATGGSEAHTTRIKCINSVLMTLGFLSPGIDCAFLPRKETSRNGCPLHDVVKLYETKLRNELSL